MYSKEKIKEYIEILIEKNKIKEAKQYVDEYSKIVEDDIDIFSIKAVIAIMEEKYYLAEKLINDGIRVCGKNFDLIYNKAYIKEIKQQYEEAITLYEEALSLTTDVGNKSNIKNIIASLSDKQKIKADKNKTFIFLSSCGWAGMLQRPHHMARALNKLGNDVHYITSNDIELNVETSEISIEDCVRDSILNRKNIQGLYIYSPLRLKRNNNIFMTNRLQLIQTLIDNSNEEVVIVVYFPQYTEIIENLKGIFKVVYECVDDHSDLEYSFWSSKHDIEFEQQLLDNSEIVLTTSNSLYLSKSILENRNNIYLSKNAVNKEDFFDSNNITIPHELLNIPSPRVCYVGAVDKWFDEELFYQLVRRNKDKSFVVIGPVRENMLLQKEDNLYILGIKEHKDLNNYLRNMQIGIIPFKDNIDLIINCDPIKLYEYVCANLPVVSTNLPELFLNEEFIKTEHNIEDFNNAINDLITSKINNLDANRFLELNTWTSRANHLLSILNFKIDKCNISNTIKNIRSCIGKSEKNLENPIVKSLYSMTFFCENDDKCLKLSKDAYKNDKNSFFILKNYINALIKNDMLDEAIDVILNSELIDECYIAELKKVKETNKNLSKFIVLFCIKNFNFIRNNIVLLDKFYLEYEKANYYFHIGKYKDCIEIYNTIIKNDIKEIKELPIFNKNYSELLKLCGLLHEGEKYKFKYFKLVDNLIRKENRIEKWNSLFEDKYLKCICCGSKNFNTVLKRADGNNIIKCGTCDLASLEYMPLKEKITCIYDNNYYNNDAIGGYNVNYYDYDQKTIMESKLKWIENTMIKNNKNILDIGCANGQFLNYAKEHGWNCNGVEISKEGYKKAKSKHTNIYNKELKAINIEDNTFDCITLWDVIEHYLDPIGELEEIYRILKKDGKLYISTPNHLKGIKNGENWFGYNASYEHLFYFEPDTLVNILKSVGFKIDDCFSCESGDTNILNFKNIGHVLMVSARK